MTTENTGDTGSKVEKMTYEQATEQAIQLRRQGLTYPAIAEHLKKVGYKSPFSRGNVGHLAVRQMVTKAQEEIAKAVGDDKPKVNGAQKVKEKTTQVRSASADLLDTVREVVSSQGLSVPTKMRLVEHLIKTADSF